MYFLSLFHLLATICLLSVPTHAQSNAVLSTEKARFDAMIAQDTATLRAGLHPDLLYIHSNGLEESARDLIASVASGKIVYTSFAPQQEPQVRVLGQTALADGLVQVNGLYEGDAFEVRLRYTSVYLLTDGQWQLLRWQSTGK